MAHPNQSIPILAAMAGIALFSLMDATMKSASLAAGVYNAVLFRNAIGALLLFPAWRLGGGNWPDRTRLKVHATRSAVVTAMILLFFWGLVRMPMAQAVALSFIAPLIALFLAAVMLGERIERRAVAASAIGFAGVIIIAAGRFGSAGRSQDQLWGVAAILCSAVLYAWNLILQRQQAMLADPREVALFQNIMVGAILLLAAPWLAAMPGRAALGYIAAGAAIGSVALMLLSWAYARAETQVLLPVEYTAFPWSALMGRLWFGEAVTASTVSGAILIVVACWFAARGPTEQTAL